MESLRSGINRFADCHRATSAVEFAIIAPVFVTMMFGIIVFGSYLAVAHGLQQLAAEAARASVAGVSDSERNSLAQSYIDGNIGSYPLLTASRLTRDPAVTDPSNSVFSITLRYDLSSSFIYSLPNFVPAPPSTLVRSAAIQRGGY
jgi:Flp pilus assembly protein TadG